MNKTYHKFLIILSVFILIVGVYLYFSNSLNTEAAPASSLESSLTTNSFGKIASDIAFIETLTSLKRIKIDTSLFTSKSFQSLVDNTERLEAVDSGRVNPFAPVTGNTLKSSSNFSNIKTNNPIEVNTNTAILSGSINGSITTQDPYFEYGTTNKLGEITSSVNISLIGSFVINITNLKPETNYFYKACYKKDKRVVCGDIVSFNTNKL